MAVRFVIGRAGTGKTHYCVDAIAQNLRAAAAAEVPPAFLWLVPEQATFMAERLLVTRPDLGGAFNVFVTSFRRLALLLARELGIEAGLPLDDIARLVLLEEVVISRRNNLQLFAPVADQPGFIQRLDQTLRELQQYGHTPETLRAAAARIAAQGGENVLGAKLNDLALLLETWNQSVGRRHLDVERLQAECCRRLAESRWLKGAKVWIDAFSSVNVLEMDMLAALAVHVESLEITLLTDPAAAAISNPLAPLDPLSLFARTERLYRQLLAAFERAGARVDRPFIFAGPPRRFAHSTELAHIEKQLCEPAAAPASKADSAPPRDVELWQCANPEVEVRAAARRITQLLSTGTLRYRNIGIIVPQLEGYQDAIRRVFTQHHIPHFIDVRRSIAHHPLVELLRGGVALALNQFAVEDVALVLKTGLTSIAPDDAHLVENYLLAHGLDHADWSRPWHYVEQNQSEKDPFIPPTPSQLRRLEKINAVRAAFFAVLKPWLDFAQRALKNDPAVHGGAWTRQLFDLLKRFGAPPRMTALIENARAADDQELLMIHQQTWRQIVAMFESLERALAGRAVPLPVFARQLNTALESLTLGLIPPTVDQVLVSSVDRSRHPELAVAIILGAVEEKFPMVKPEDPLLSDHQRAVFNQTSEQAIGMDGTQLLLEARFFDYIAFTRAHQRLILSFPQADLRGRALVTSQHVGNLRRLFPGLVPKVFDAIDTVEHVGTADELVTCLLQWAGPRVRQWPLRRPAEPGAAADAATIAQLYQWTVTQKDNGISATLKKAWPALLPEPPARLSPRLAAQFFEPHIPMSVSQLEGVAACALQYFLQYTLGLRERQTFQLDTLNLGLLYHRILERVFDRAISGELPWPECSEKDLLACMEIETDRAITEIHAELAENTPRYGNVRQRVKRTLGIVLEAQRRLACVGKLRPVATEVNFGQGPRRDAPPPVAPKLTGEALVISTSTGHSVDVRGKIDRIDADDQLNAQVIDYKSRKKEMSLAAVYHGLALQLPVYLLAVEKLRRQGDADSLRPIAGFFVPLQRNRATEKDPREAPAPPEDAFFQKPKPRGLVIDETARLLDNSMAAGKSAWLPIIFNQDGQLSKLATNDAISAEDFTLVLRYTQHKIAAMVDALVQGHITANPYRDGKKIPCTYCAYGCMCPFDPVTGDFRELPPLKKTEALYQMRVALGEAKGGPAHG